jgi:branched-chain amino acid transport system ATP-binding protein
MSQPILETRSLSKTFGSLCAVDGIDLEIPRGSLVSVIGPNGAGKTTLFDLITGKHDPSSGRILFQADRIGGLQEFQIARRGIARSYQITNFYPQLTVKENVRLAAQAQRVSLRDQFRHHKHLDEVQDRTENILDRIGLLERASEEAQTLSHGQQRHLEVGIALGSDPDLLLLDEPTAGMSTEETAEIKRLIQELAGDITLLMVEHDMEIVMDVSDQIAVVNNGTLVVKGTPEEVRQNERVQSVYLRRE